MKVGIDTFGTDNAKSGIGTCLLNFINNIPSDSGIEFELFGSETDRYTFTSNSGLNYISIKIPDTKRSEFYWHNLYIRKFLKKHKYDALIFPASENVISSTYNKKSIAIVNSLFPKDKKKQTGYFKHHVLRGLKKAGAVIATSNAIKENLVTFGVDEAKISVIYNGIDHKLFFPMMDMNEDIIEINPFAIKRPYFIYASRLSGPEKKHIELIKAFNLFKRNTGLPHRLVIAGEYCAYAEEIQKVISESDYASDIFVTGFFQRESFAKLYAGADASIFPAVNEGVGLPVIEAMSCGVPVLCSDSGVLKEIGKDAVIYFDSDNIEQMAQEMQKIVENDELRKELIDKGIRQSAVFNLDETVQKLIDIIKSI